MKKLLLSCAVAVLACVGASAQTIIFEETFDNVTVGTTNMLTSSGLTDESGYENVNSPNKITCETNGILSMTGARFSTKKIDLSGDDVYLYVTFKFTASSTGGFQIALDVEGTSGVGGVLNLKGNASNAPTEFETREFLLTGGTENSFIQFRAESSASLDIDKIKITKGSDSSTNINSTIADKDAVSIEYYNLLGKKVSAESNGFVIEKSTFTDGTTSSKKLFLTK